MGLFPRYIFPADAVVDEIGDFGDPEIVVKLILGASGGEGDDRAAPFDLLEQGPYIGKRTDRFEEPLPVEASLCVFQRLCEPVRLSPPEKGNDQVVRVSH